MRGVLSRGGESNATMFGGLTSGGVPPEFCFHSESKGFLNVVLFSLYHVNNKYFDDGLPKMKK